MLNYWILLGIFFIALGVPLVIAGLRFFLSGSMSFLLLFRLSIAFSIAFSIVFRLVFRLAFRLVFILVFSIVAPILDLDLCPSWNCWTTRTIGGLSILWIVLFFRVVLKLLDELVALDVDGNRGKCHYFHPDIKR